MTSKIHFIASRPLPYYILTRGIGLVSRVWSWNLAYLYSMFLVEMWWNFINLSFILKKGNVSIISEHLCILDQVWRLYIIEVKNKIFYFFCCSSYQPFKKWRKHAPMRLSDSFLIIQFSLHISRETSIKRKTISTFLLLLVVRLYTWVPVSTTNLAVFCRSSKDPCRFFFYL